MKTVFFLHETKRARQEVGHDEGRGAIVKNVASPEGVVAALGGQGRLQRHGRPRIPFSWLEVQKRVS